MGRPAVRLALASLVCSFVPLVGAGPGSAAVFTGYGFDTCTAPQLSSLDAWLASPYRAVGIYLGGANRACADGALSASWVGFAGSAGWGLIPLYVGLQAPCVAQAKLAKIDPSAAAAQGTQAAQDAFSLAAVFGIPPGNPIYFDMEGYKTTDPACTKAVQAFVGAWDTGLRAAGYVAGVYGSAASTIRDLAAMPANLTPDDVWIANWNAKESVFGDPYVSDSLWPNHQRLHQYKGGHRETWGGVTLNIDSDYLDGAIASPTVAPPPPPSTAGSVGSGDGKATAAWPDGTFAAPAAVTLTVIAAQSSPGFGAPVDAVQLSALQVDTHQPLTSFAAPVTVHFVPLASGAVPAFSPEGVTWTAIARLTAAGLPAGAASGYTRQGDGSVDIQTRTPGFFALFADTIAPAAPTGLAGRFSSGALRLAWRVATDNSGSVASYQVNLGGKPLLTTPTTSVTVRAINAKTASVYRVIALDPAGNASRPSQPLVVVPTPQPRSLPRPLPAWAWQLLAWQRHRRATRPASAPRAVPGWYRRWSAWRAHPFRIKP
jgi:hypothetical protein